MPESPDPHVGLCAVCRHARIVRTPRSAFWLCELAKVRPAFERYPRLPRLACDGHEPGTPREGAEPER